MDTSNAQSALAHFRAIKNSIIGNPTAKVKQATEFSVTLVVDWLNAADGGDPVVIEKARIEAAHVVSSLCYGSPEALYILLVARAHQALLHSVSHFQPSDSFALRLGHVRALKSIAVATADATGPPQYGLGPRITDEAKWNEFRGGLEELYDPEALDIFLPLLLDSSSQITGLIASMLSSSVRLAPHRKLVIDWLPPSDRAKESKGKRGWEKPDVARNKAVGTMKEGGWTTRRLLSMLSSSDVKVQEAALLALAAIGNENAALAAIVFPETDASRHTSSPNPQAHLSVMLNLTKSRITEVRLAACTCLVQLLWSRYHFVAPTSHPLYERDAQTVIGVLNNLINDPEQSDSVRMRASFTLSRLVVDEKDLQRTAYECGSLPRLAELLHIVTPGQEKEWPDDEPEIISRLREGILMALASMTLHVELIRRALLSSTPHVLSDVVRCLSHDDAGVRFSACHCARAFSKSVYVLRTSIGDSDLALNVLRIMNSDPDDRVQNAALLAIGNLVHDFSPTRAVLMEFGTLLKLVNLVKSGAEPIKLNAVWALRNALNRSSPTEKKLVATELGWEAFSRLLEDKSSVVKEQATASLGNMATTFEDIDFLFDSGGREHVLSVLGELMQSDDDDVAKQARIAHANLESLSSLE